MVASSCMTSQHIDTTFMNYDIYKHTCSYYTTLITRLYYTISVTFQILVHLGLLSQKAGFKIAENSFRGKMDILVES